MTTECALIPAVTQAWANANAEIPKYKLDPEIFDINTGLSGARYRVFLNDLIEFLADARYLEIGVWTGSTLCSAINGNRVSATVIDNWSQGFGILLVAEVQARNEFFFNLEKFRNPGSDVTVIESDFRKVDFHSIGKFNVYFYDAGHEEQDQYDGIRMALPALDDEFILIVDDWNEERVRQGTLRAIVDLKLTVLLNHFVRTGLVMKGSWRDHSNWFNGTFVAVLQKGGN